MTRRALSFLLLLATVACGGGGGGAATEGLTVAMMPKNKGNPYFASCRQGAEEAAKELGVKLLWDGPTETDAAKQNEVVEAWITRGVNVIAVSVENREGLSTVLRKARGRGIKVAHLGRRRRCPTRASSSSTRRRRAESRRRCSTTRAACWAARASSRSSPRR